MKIPADLLAEKNYDGARLLEITDKKVIELKKEIETYQPIAKPHLDKMAELGKQLDPHYTKIRELDAEKEKIKKEMQPTLDAFNAELKHMEEVQQKTDILKDKIRVIISKLLEKELGEFESAKELRPDEKTGKLYVEIIDEIEEKIKAIRMVKAKK